MSEYIRMYYNTPKTEIANLFWNCAITKTIQVAKLDGH